jgi:hypothetical protein
MERGRPTRWNTRKYHTAFTLSEECKVLLDKLSADSGISRTDVVEILVRERARGSGIVYLKEDKPIYETPNEDSLNGVWKE